MKPFCVYCEHSFKSGDTVYFYSGEIFCDTTCLHDYTDEFGKWVELEIEEDHSEHVN